MQKILIIALSFILLPLSAQETKEEKVQLTPAEQLMKVMRLEDSIIETGAAGFSMVEQSLATQKLTQDELTEVKDAYMVYIMKFATDPEFKTKSIEAYNKNFTEDEIMQLVEFYQSSIGQKSLERIPAITGEVMAFSQKLAQRHVGIFQEALAEILARKAAREMKETEKDKE